MPADNQMRMLSAQFVSAKALLFQLAVAEIFQEHVRARQQRVHGLSIGGLCEIQHNAALAAIEQREERRSHPSKAAGLVAAGRLNLDDLGTELRQDHAAG